MHKNPNKLSLNKKLRAPNRLALQNAKPTTISPQCQPSAQITSESILTSEVPKDNMHVKCFVETTAYSIIIHKMNKSTVLK